MENNKALSLIGLATKAGKTVSGEFSTEKSVKTGKGYLAIVAGDSSEKSIPGHCLGRGVGKYKEEVPEYVYLLRSAFIHPF